MKWILFLSLLAGCDKQTGTVDRRCNPDGSCDSDKLRCVSNGMASWCQPLANESPKRCHFESECFCLTCADKCGDAGVKTCAFSDTSVWGSKPSVCECK